MELLATVTWAGVLSWFVEFMKMVIPAGLGFGAALLTIKHQIKKHNDSKIEGYLNVAITEVYNSYVYAYELFLCAYFMHKTGRRLFIDRPLNTEIFHSISTGFAECVVKELIEPFVRIRDIKDNQDQLIEKGGRSLEHCNRSDLSDERWGKEAERYSEMASKIAYYGSNMVRVLPKRFKRRVTTENELIRELKRLRGNSHNIIKNIAQEISQPITETEIEILINEAVEIMKRLEQEDVSFYHIEKTRPK